jgi:putative endonuclease
VTATRSRRSAASEPARVAARPPRLPRRHVLGRDAEAIAAEALLANGFRILWRNLRIGSLELDLVAQRGDLVVVVEVRARGPGSFEKPLASISRTKRQTLLRATRALWKGRLAQRKDVKRLRIDVAAVTRDAEGASRLEWIAGALTEDDG